MLSIRPFRRLWIATSLSSLGDWLSLVALSTLALTLAGRGLSAQGAAVGGVWLISFALVAVNTGIAILLLARGLAVRAAGAAVTSRAAPRASSHAQTSTTAGRRTGSGNSSVGPRPAVSERVRSTRLSLAAHAPSSMVATAGTWISLISLVSPVMACIVIGPS